MKEIKDLYNINLTKDNIVYSLDMLRLKTYVDYNIYSNLDFYIRTYYSNEIKKNWITDRIMQFKYNWSIEVEEGKSFYIGFHHNNEKKDEHEGRYNLTVEFNPNKIKDNPLLLHILNLSGDWYIKSYDVAFDVRVNINNLLWDMSGRNLEKIDNRGFDNKTIMLGKGNGRVKIYNKKRESDLNIIGDLTRVEISREVEDFEVRKINLFQYDDMFPTIYLGNYVYSLSDYQDKTTLALLFAVQNGFPIRDLTYTYRKKIQGMLQGGYKIEFDNKVVTELLQQTVKYYFLKNNKVVWW